MFWHVPADYYDKEIKLCSIMALAFFSKNMLLSTVHRIFYLCTCMYQFITAGRIWNFNNILTTSHQDEIKQSYMQSFNKKALFMHMIVTLSK